MAATHKVPRSAERSTLLVVTDEVDERLVWRAAAIAAGRDSELQVYCPVVMPPAPHSGVPGNAPPWKDDVGLAREHGRRKVGKIMSLLSEQPVESHVETGICPSVTTGIIGASRRLEPDLVLLPEPREHTLLEEPFHTRYEDLWPNVGAPIWILHHDRLEGATVGGLVFLDSRSKRDEPDHERVVAYLSLVARQLGSSAHLIGCVGPAPALALAKEAFPPSGGGIAQYREDAMVRRLYELADTFDIPRPQVHLIRGTAGATLPALLRRLDLGLIVASGRPRRRLGRLLGKQRASELLELDCDLLILGEFDVAHA